MRRNPLPAGEHFQAAAFGDGRVVAVGNTGTVATSTNGLEWMKESLPETPNEPFDKSLLCVAFGDHRFVTGGNRSLFYSSDGKRWAQGPENVRGWAIRGLAFGKGRFVGVGSLGPIYSKDGEIWELSTWDPITLGAPQYLKAVATGPEGFVAVDSLGSVFQSDEGIDWKKTGHIDGDPSGIAFGNGRWVVVGFPANRIFNSTNGVDWKAVVAPGGSTNRLVSVGFVDGQFTAVGGSEDAYTGFGIVLSSVDGVDWRQEVAGAPHLLTGFAGGGGIRIAVGYRGLIISDGVGDTWKIPNRVATEDNLSSVVSVSGGIYATGWRPERMGPALGTILFSKDNQSWSTVFEGPNVSLFGICSGPGLLVAVGTREGPNFSEGVIISSPDGLAWSRQDLSTDFYKVRFGNGRFVAIGTGGCYYSLNGGIWVKATNSPAGYRLWFAGGKFFADNRKQARGLEVSEDGATWQFVGLENGVSGVVWATGKYIATGFGVNAPGHGVFFSANGTSWQRQSITVIPTAPDFGRDSFDLQLVADDQLIAMGNFFELNKYLGQMTGAIYSSFDGIHWVRRFKGISSPISGMSPFQGLTFAAGSVIGIGDGGLIVQSGTLSSPVPYIDKISLAARLRLTVSSPVGRDCEVQYTDFLDPSGVWAPLTTVPVLESPFTVIDAERAGRERRFYRAVVLP